MPVHSSFLLQQRPVVSAQGEAPRADPWSTELPPLFTVPGCPMGLGFLGALTGTLWASGGAINSQNIKKTRKKESDEFYQDTEQRGSAGVSVGISLSCTWMCKHLTLALLQWPGLTPAVPGHKGAAAKAWGQQRCASISCSALTLTHTWSANCNFSSPLQWCMSCESWELGIHKQDLNSQRRSSSPQSPIPSGSSLPRGQPASVNSSLHPDD